MIKLKSLISNIRENQEAIDADQWDSWSEYIENFGDNLDITEVKKLIEKFKLEVQYYFENHRVIRLSDENEKREAYLLNDPPELTYIEDIDNWIYEINDFKFSTINFGINSDDIYNIWVDARLKDLKINPPKVYHWTDEEKLKLIQDTGKILQSWGTGINNRGARGIFTSVDPEEHSNGSYGNICLEINLKAFKNASTLDKLDLEFEPEVTEYLIRDYLRSALERPESRDNIPSDMSPYTIIVNHDIPVEFIKKHD